MCHAEVSDGALSLTHQQVPRACTPTPRLMRGLSLPSMHCEEFAAVESAPRQWKRLTCRLLLQYERGRSAATGGARCCTVVAQAAGKRSTASWRNHRLRRAAHAVPLPPARKRHAGRPRSWQCVRTQVTGTDCGIAPAKHQRGGGYHLVDSASASVQDPLRQHSLCPREILHADVHRLLYHRKALTRHCTIPGHTPIADVDAPRLSCCRKSSPTCRQGHCVPTVTASSLPASTARHCAIILVEQLPKANHGASFHVPWPRWGPETMPTAMAQLTALQWP